MRAKFTISTMEESDKILLKSKPSIEELEALRDFSREQASREDISTREKGIHLRRIIRANTKLEEIDPSYKRAKKIYEKDNPSRQELEYLLDFANKKLAVADENLPSTKRSEYEEFQKDATLNLKQMKRDENEVQERIFKSEQSYKLVKAVVKKLDGELDNKEIPTNDFIRAYKLSQTRLNSGEELPASIRTFYKDARTDCEYALKERGITDITNNPEYAAMVIPSNYRERSKASEESSQCRMM